MWWNSYSTEHYIDVIMTTMASQITSLTVVFSTVYSDAYQRKHQSSASLAFVWGIHRDRWIPRTKGQLRGKCFHLMTSSWTYEIQTVSITCTKVDWNQFSIAVTDVTFTFPLNEMANWDDLWWQFFHALHFVNVIGEWQRNIKPHSLCYIVGQLSFDV